MRARDAAIGVIALAAGVGVSSGMGHPLFRDEGASWYSARLGWSALWSQSRVVDLVVLPYYAFLHFWVDVDGGVVWLRLPSLVAYVATVWVVGRVGARLGGALCGLLTAVLAATNPLLVEAALYARPYALATLGATLAVAALVRWYDGGAPGWLWCFAVASSATLALQLFCVLAPLSALAVVVLLRPAGLRGRWGPARTPLLTLGAVVLCGVVVSVGQRGQITWITPLRGGRAVKAVLGPAYGGSGTYTVFLAVLVVAAGFTCLWATRARRFRPPARWTESFVVAVCWAVVPTVLLVGISLLRPVYVARYVTASAPGLALASGLLVAIAVHLLGSRRPPGWWTATATATVVVVAVLGSVLGLVPGADQTTEHLDTTTRYVETRAVGDAELALPDHSLTTVVEYYLGRAHTQLQLWPQVAAQPAIEGLDLRTDRHAVAVGPPDVWLIDDGSTSGLGRWVDTLDAAGYVRVEHFHRGRS